MLITIRHGQTDFNAKRIFSGRTNTPKLTNKAKEDAYLKGKELVDYNIDLAIVSPLNRAIETFEEINKTLNISKIIDERIIERDFKKYDGKDFDLIDKDKYLDVLNQNLYDIETIDEIVLRVKTFLDEIKDKYKDKNILIVSHSQICKVIKYILNGYKETNLNNYAMGNLHVEVYKEW